MKILTEEQLVRKWVRQILEESTSTPLNEQGELSKIFVEPFTDVFKTAKVAFKDILTSAKFTFDMLVTFDPVKLKGLRDNFKERKKNIAAEYDEVMQSTYAALDSPDVKLVSFMLNPAGHMAKVLVKTGVETVPDAVNFFREAGFGSPSAAERGGAAGAAGAAGQITDPKGIVGTAFGALKKLFFLDAHHVDGQLMFEQEKGEKEKPAVKKGPEMAMAALEELGVLDDIKKATEDILEMAEESLNEIKELFKPNTEIIAKISAAQDLDELMTAVKEAKSAGLDLGGMGETQLKADMDKQVDEFLADDKAKKGLIKQLADREGIEPKEGEETPKIPDDKLRQETQKIFFVNSSQGLRDAMAESEEKIKEQMIEEISVLKEDLGIDDESMKMLNQTAVGKKLLDLFKKTEEELNV